MPTLFLDSNHPSGTKVQLIAYDTTGWTQEDLERGILVEAIPEPENNGKGWELHINKDTKDMWYEYFELPLTPEQVIQKLRNEMATVKAENEDLKLAIVESAEAQQQDKIENQLAIAELAELIATKEV
ncbi:hypothetical protein [Lysinibacillus sp. FSL L8-0126]|uniref:hypothetical protein n=1 Tax=Lysinibacillus sp. FSL L8-0126 TaxID=2921515 RepID=UPI00315A7A8F